MIQIPARFRNFYEEFRTTPLWTAMANTHENTPWHREESVAVHTNMLIEWYQENIIHKGRSEHQQMLSLVSCLMHDTGKPMAEVTKQSEERGFYHSYAGHEILSARLWIDYALTNKQFVCDLLRFGLDDIANVALMVEHHVPFAMTNKQKRKALKQALLLRTGATGHEAWLDFLLSDQHGRISDDQPTKLASVAKWMEEWEKV